MILCKICNAFCQSKIICPKCYKKLEEEAAIEAEIEFQRQSKLTFENKSKIFKRALNIVANNSNFEKFTDEKITKYLHSEFLTIYEKEFINSRLYTIANGKFKAPNE